jgi:hypothetical protein
MVTPMRCPRCGTPYLIPESWTRFTCACGQALDRLLDSRNLSGVLHSSGGGTHDREEEPARRGPGPTGRAGDLSQEDGSGPAERQAGRAAEEGAR